MTYTICRFLLPYKYQRFTSACIMQIAQDADHPLSDVFQNAIMLHLVLTEESL